MLKMYFALFLQEKEAVRRVMIQLFSGVCEFLMNFRVICYPVLHLPSVHLSPANCFQAPCQDVYSRPLHDSFTHECHTETSSSKSLLTPAMISNSKIWLFPYMCSLKIPQSEFIFLLLTCNAKDELGHRVISIPEAHLQCHMMGTCLGRTDPEVLTHSLALPATL